MGNSPFDYIINYEKAASKKLIKNGFVHRTFNVNDLDFFLQSLSKIYKQYQSLENVFVEEFKLKQHDELWTIENTRVLGRLRKL